jgi:hypothetical protein
LHHIGAVVTGDDAQYIATDVYFSQKNNGVSPQGKNAVNGCDRYVTRAHYRSATEAISKRYQAMTPCYQAIPARIKCC